MQAALAHDAPADWSDLLAADPAADACHCRFWTAAVARHTSRRALTYETGAACRQRTSRVA